MYLHRHRYTCNTMQTSLCEVDHVLFWPDHFTLNIWIKAQLHTDVWVNSEWLSIPDRSYPDIKIATKSMAPHVFVDRWVLLQLLFLGVVYPLHGLWAEMQLLAGWMVRFWQHLGCPWLLCWGNPDETDETTMNQMRWEYMNTRQRAFRIDPETSWGLI